MMLATAYQASQETVLNNGTDAKRDGKDVTIHSTRNYSMFRFSSANRPISQDHLERLYDAISKKNLLHRYPILVTSGHLVIDGQHRLKVAEALHVPIYYQIADDMSVGDIAAHNALAKPWSPEDYLNYWCEQGNEEYIKIRALWKRYDWLPISFIKAILSKSTKAHGSATHQFQNGTMKADKLYIVEWVADSVIQFKSHLRKGYRSRSFIGAVYAMLCLPGYSQDTMMERLEVIGTRLVPCATTQEYVELLASIYNYNLMRKNRLDISDWRKYLGRLGNQDEQEQATDG